MNMQCEVEHFVGSRQVGHLLSPDSLDSTVLFFVQAGYKVYHRTSDEVHMHKGRCRVEIRRLK